MSRVKVQNPIIHTPKFNEYWIAGAELARKYSERNIEQPFPISDKWYYFTDVEGWAKLLSDLVMKSNLYKADRFDCEDYAIKAQVTCAERYGLNTLRYTYGLTLQGAHGFNSFWTGDRIMLFEPNDGYQYEELMFEIGDYEYTPLAVLL